MEKANWLIDGDDIRVVMPFQKVDREKRTTSGFATLNNVDSSDDVVTSECSADAFSRFRGNIREMHQPIAVGSMLSFAQEPYFDANTGMMYEGIYMNTYVSKGAADTWEKVLDKTLTGYSIGGVIIESHQEYIPEMNKTIRFIDKMDLHEVSLVDNPANPLANILSIQKVDGHYVAKGLAVDVNTENVFYCPEHQVGRTSASESLKCRSGDHQMENVGWIEITKGVDRNVELKKTIDNHIQKVLTTRTIKEGDAEKNPDQKKELANEENIGDNETKKSEGGVNMTDENKIEAVVDVDETKAAELAQDEQPEKTFDEGTDGDPKTNDNKVHPNDYPTHEDLETGGLKSPGEPHPNDAPTADDLRAKTEASEQVSDEAKAAHEEEVHSEKAVEGTDLEKAIGEIVTVVGDVAKALASLATVVTEVKDGTETLATAQKSAQAALDESLDSVGKRLGNLEKATAGKKSGDDTEVSSEPINKFSWDGHFASASSIVK